MFADILGTLITGLMGWVILQNIKSFSQAVEDAGQSYKSAIMALQEAPPITTVPKKNPVKWFYGFGKGKVRP